PVQEPVQVGEDDLAGASQLKGQSGVDDVLAGHTEMDLGALVTQLLLNCADEGGEVVALLGLDLGNALPGGWFRPTEGGHLWWRDLTQSRPRLADGQLHLEPELEPGLVRPKLPQFLGGVAVDHA